MPPSNPVHAGKSDSLKTKCIAGILILFSSKYTVNACSHLPPHRFISREEKGMHLPTKAIISIY